MSDFDKKDDMKDRSQSHDHDSDKRKIYLRRKICRFCNDKNLEINYKRSDILRKFVTEGGKIIPRRMSGNCAKHQRLIAHAIKRARAISLLPYVKQ
jgi:small subunit ribosomal protein S18